MSVLMAVRDGLYGLGGTGPERLVSGYVAQCIGATRPHGCARRAITYKVSGTKNQDSAKLWRIGSHAWARVH